MAEFLAVTIQNTINNSFHHSKPFPVVFMAIKKPMIAKGKANTLCANNTSEKYFFIFIPNLLNLDYACRLFLAHHDNQILDLFYRFPVKALHNPACFVLK